jgi:hypothetical protein
VFVADDLQAGMGHRQAPLPAAWQVHAAAD